MLLNNGQTTTVIIIFTSYLFLVWDKNALYVLTVLQ